MLERLFQCVLFLLASVVVAVQIRAQDEPIELEVGKVVTFEISESDLPLETEVLKAHFAPGPHRAKRGT